MNRERYRLKQDGIPVAWVEGPTAIVEIKHYAMVYGQDGPVLIEKHEGGEWKAWPPRRRKSAIRGIDVGGEDQADPSG